MFKRIYFTVTHNLKNFKLKLRTIYFVIVLLIDKKKCGVLSATNFWVNGNVKKSNYHDCLDISRIKGTCKCGKTPTELEAMIQLNKW